mmetsp:Transcript_10262/g.11697  ORF Transcript_10262/g.11697 Transcript_10262/m.11697 type:complete len:105 (-) Transcript_10262:16-330(-)
MEERKISSNEEMSDSDDYDFKIRSPQKEFEKALSETKIPRKANELIIFKKALQNACDENNILRGVVIDSRRKTAQLKLENNDLKEVLVELTDAIEYHENEIVKE